ncbi:MAG: hypothetical protein RL014_2727 [Pseudomonadota bacterium]
MLGLWTYRGFIAESIRRDFHSRYRASLLGGLWAVISPLALIGVYTLAFSHLVRATLPGHQGNPLAFSIYLCAGLLTWGLFAETLSRLTSVFLDYANLLKKASFPRLSLIAIVIGSALVNFSIVITLYIGFLVFVGHWPGWVVLWVLPLLALQQLFAVGLGLFLGTLNVFFRDIGQFTSVLLQFWFWLTPVVYTLPALPQGAQRMLAYNPMVDLIASYQQIFLLHQPPQWPSLVPLLLLSLIVLTVGAVFFMRRQGEMVDEL